MAAENPNPPDSLREEILADARREREEILRHARQAADALLTRATAEAEEIRRDNLAQAQAEADRRRELILATVAVEVGRMRAAQIETWLQSILEATRQKLQNRDGFDYRATIIALAAEALKRMTGNTFEVRLTPADHEALGNGLADQIRQHVGRPLTITMADDLTAKDGGVIIQDPEGRQIWDNRFQSRLERLWPELRRQIAITTSLVAQSGSLGSSAISEPVAEVANPAGAAARPSTANIGYEERQRSAEAPLRSRSSGKGGT